MHLERLRKLNDCTYQEGAVLYWMDRDMRLHDNWALVATEKLARQHHVPFGIIYNLVPDYLGGGLRQLTFKIQALQELEAVAREKNIPFFVLTEDIVGALPAFATKYNIGLVVTDFNPLRVSTHWKSKIAKALPIPLVQVDAHNIVPCWLASPKQEFAARTFRPKITKLLPKFLDEFPPLRTQRIPFPNFPKTDWKKLENLPSDASVEPVSWAIGGEKSAHRMLDSFLTTRLHGYAEKRNDPNEDSLSKLSPYFHYGNLAPQRAALRAKKALHSRRATRKDVDAFLEEMIVRRELSDNFCFYNPHYDSFQGIADWAKRTLEKHRDDVREYIYSRNSFEEARTHDALWNAAQNEMVRTGKMHGFMRMYWAKKILEWTKSPEDALRIAIYLNDKYELDGRDPNGYVGCMWSIGGVHDRAWFERPVFGQIRYMNESGCKRKFDTARYIKRWQ